MKDQKNTLITSVKDTNGMEEDRFPKGIIFFILVLSAVLMILTLLRR